MSRVTRICQGPIYHRRALSTRPSEDNEACAALLPPDASGSMNPSNRLDVHSTLMRSPQSSTATATVLSSGSSVMVRTK